MTKQPQNTAAALLCAALLLWPSAARAGDDDMAPLTIAGVVVLGVSLAGAAAGLAMTLAGAGELDDVERAYGCEAGECPDEATAELDAATSLRTAGLGLTIGALVTTCAGVGLVVGGRLTHSSVALRVGPGSLELVGSF